VVGGITSWATACIVIERHGKASTTLLFADTNAEDEDLHRWNRDAAAQLGMEFVRVADPQERDPWQVFEDAGWIGNTRLSQCSHELKQKPCRIWLSGHADPASTVVYIGIDWSETGPHPRYRRRVRPPAQQGLRPQAVCWPVRRGRDPVAGSGCKNLLPRNCHGTSIPLTQPPARRKDEWFAEARAAGLTTPRLYDLGFAHNNCGGACPKGGQAQWARLLDVFPERFAKVEAFEQRMRARLGKDVSILRDRTGGTTTPLTLTALRARIEDKPDQLDLFDEGGCGCFTEGAPHDPPADVLYRHRDDLFDTTATSWDARSLKPLEPAPDPTAKPPEHRSDCYFATWPSLADLCGCATNPGYLRAQHPH